MARPPPSGKEPAVSATRPQPDVTPRVTSRYKLVVVPHTHWDREWYQPFEVFRVKLVRLIDRVLAMMAADPGYGHFMLDGQTIVLEDYLAIRPEREAELRGHVASGRIAVGPWYVLPDTFLVSAESLVRNLQIGMATARRFGRSMEIGYLPDSFGHLAQTPQLFRGFGFETASLWRGVGDENPGCQWLWEAPDGSRVYVQWLSGGYGNLANLPASASEAYERLAREVAVLAERSKGTTLLLMNGSDHLMPQPFLPAHIRAWAQRNPEWEIVQGSLAEAIAGARAEAGDDLPVVRGELRQAADTSLLPGVLSARTYLKTANAAMQTLLERWVEPFSALAAVRGVAGPAHPGREHPRAFIRQAWKTLLENHPHDSICGCSVDSVHDQMTTRFMQVSQLGETLRHEALAALAGEDPEADLPRQDGLRLYNPHPWGHVAAVEAVLTLDCEPGEEPLFALVDEEGQAVPCEVVALERGVRVVNRSPAYPYNVATARATVRLAASLPPLGFRTLKVSRSPLAAPREAELRHGADWIENRHFRVKALPGGVEILDKALGETVVHTFEDRGDRGDEYNFCPVEGEAPLSSRESAWDGVRVEASGASLRLELLADWMLPAGLSADRKRREGEVRFGVALAATLTAGVRRVDFQLACSNFSEDHRFRAAFRLPGAIAETIADTAWGFVTRDARVPEKAWAEKPMGTFPMASQVHVARPGGRVALAAPGLHEYEAVGDTLHLALIRAVGWLSREDLSTRQGDAGPMLAAPGAQMIGDWAFRYAWTSEGAGEAEGTAWRRATEFVVPAQAFPLAAWKGHATASWLSVDQAAWGFSALKRAEGSEHLVLRVFSGSAEPTTGEIRLGFPVRAARRARLDETPLEDAPLEEGVLRATLRPFEIATWLLEAGEG
jgi:alpha-mannosidase